MADVVEEKPVLEKAEKYNDDVSLMDDLIGKSSKKELIEEDELDEEEVKPEIELEDDDEEEKEDIIEEQPETVNYRNIDLKKVKEKYPEFAKTNEFRELRNAYHREGEYTTLFPTLDDAREAAENNDTFVKLNDALINRGDVGVLLNAVKEASPDAAKKIATGFLDALGKFDQNLYLEAVSPVIKRLARQINAEGQKYLKRNKESEDGLALVATARNLTQFAFDDPEIPDKDEAVADPKISDKERELSERENKIRADKFSGAYSIASNSVEKHLDRQILANLDPDNKLSEFVKDSLLEKIKKEVKDQVGKDSIHVRKMNSLWNRAEQSDFSRESLSSIVSAYLERARPIIPTVRNKYKTIALKGKTDSSPEKGIKIPNTGKTGRSPERDGKVNLRAVDSKKIDYRNTSDEDIFEGRVKLKA